MNKLNLWAIAFAFLATACSPSKTENSDTGMKIARTKAEILTVTLKTTQ